MRVSKYSHFKPNSFGHGGEKRAAQITELLIEAGVKYDDVCSQLKFPPAKSLSSVWEGFLHADLLSNSLKNIYAAGRYLKAFKSYIKFAQPSLVLLEATNDFNLLFASVLNKCNIPFICLPHNLESLVPGAFNNLSDAKISTWLTYEIARLRFSEQIFTISKEEQWLLALHGCNAQYLPYFPTRTTRIQLLKIRTQREKNFKINCKKKRVLLLGTFHNIPTLIGYKSLLLQIKDISDLELNVVGYGSEALDFYPNNPNIHIWGSVSNDVLWELMLKCHFAIIQQEPTSGALTRIPELLVAGVPVIANFTAARSAYHYNGVYVYQNHEGLVELLRHSPTSIPPLPERPTEELQFISYMRNHLLTNACG